MADDPLRSANKAYYASKKHLNLQGPKEGRKNPRPAPSYVHKVNEVASSSKYYKGMAVSPAAENIKSTSKSEGTIRTVTKLKANARILEQVVSAFGDGAGAVLIEGSKEELQSIRTKVDLAVGRKTLTRAQADAVSFVPVAPVAEVKPEVVQEPVVEAAVVTPAPEPFVPAAVASPVAEPVAQDVSAEAQKEEITESDIANAFGVTDSDD